MTTLLTSGEQIKAGKVMPLAVATRERHPAYPAIATFVEQGFGDVRGDTWFWLAGPKNLPADVVTRLNAEMRHINKSAKMREQFARLADLLMCRISALSRVTTSAGRFFGP